MRRLVPILLTFTAALAAFVLLRGPEPAPSFGPPAPAAPRAAAAADAEIARLQSAARAAPRDVAPRVALASAYLQKARETGDPGFYSRADELLRAARARGSRSRATTSAAGCGSRGAPAPRGPARSRRIPRWSTRSSSSAASAPPSPCCSG